MEDWEIIVNRLLNQGVSLTWFPFVDRDGQSQWRVCARKNDGTQIAVQSENLLAAASGLERKVCQMAEIVEV
jgi:hypothetical protein